jgi:hypothetical protein
MQEYLPPAARGHFHYFMRRRTLLAVLLGFVMASLLPGCAGYQLGPVKPKAFAAIKTVAVPMARNLTLEPRLESVVTNAIIKQLQRDGTYRVVNEKDADAILDLKIEAIIRRPGANASFNVLLSREYTLQLRVNYNFYRRDNGQRLDTRSLNGETSFFTSGTTLEVADVNQDERQAIPLAAEDLAVRVVSQISEGW